jgi:L-rhamnose mutarotase
MKRYCFALDLVDDPSLIAAYEEWHMHVWPEVLHSIRNVGISALDIYRTGNRLFMIMDTGPDFSFERKAASDNADPKVQEWETLMWKYQQAVPTAKPGEKWVLMKQIFSLADQPGPSL